MITLEFIRNELIRLMIKNDYSEEQARWDFSIRYPEYDELIWNTPLTE